MNVKEMKIIESKDLNYQELNQIVRWSLEEGEDRLLLRGVNGHRYIGVGLEGKARLEVEGTPGNNLGAMMNGLTVSVYGNAQDGVGNTMHSGVITIWGMAGDIVGYGMRGGKIFVRDDVGWRVGIHMKGNESTRPVIMIGGKAGDFLGEYMAGGTIVVLGVNEKPNDAAGANNLVGKYIASGMHGGQMYIRGTAPEWQIPEQARVEEITPEQCGELQNYINEFAREFDLDCSDLRREVFTRITPCGTRPYAHLYDHSA